MLIQSPGYVCIFTIIHVHRGAEAEGQLYEVEAVMDVDRS